MPIYNRAEWQGSELKPAHLAVLRGIQELRKNTKYADLTVKCDERMWRVHKAIICPQSQFFAKACDGNFKEAESNTIMLVDDDPAAVAAMIHYFYHSEYNGEDWTNSETSVEMVHIRVYALADKCFVEPLCALAKWRFRVRVSSSNSWSTPSFSDAVRELYTNYGHLSTLKTIMHETARQNPQLFVDKDTYPEFHQVLQTVPEFTLDVVGDFAKVAKPMAHIRWYRCDGESCAARGIRFALSEKPEYDEVVFCPVRCNGTASADWKYLEDGRVIDGLVWKHVDHKR